MFFIKIEVVNEDDLLC